MKNKFLFLLFLLSACSSEPVSNAPAWTKGPSRVVDNGYIVYVGSAEAPNTEKAQFKAEGLALEDLANECSLLPKGTRIEDRYSEKDKYDEKAYVKVAVEFTQCEEAQKAVDPNEIKKIANATFTEQLKNYQDLMETGEWPDKSENQTTEALAQISPPPQKQNWNDNTHFYVMRQYVAYEKEVVILAPPTAYPVAAPQTQNFTANIRNANTQIETIQTANPTLKTQPQPWSQVPNRPSVEKPGNLTPKHSSYQQRRVKVPGVNSEKKKPDPKKPHGPGGHHRRRDT